MTRWESSSVPRSEKPVVSRYGTYVDTEQLCGCAGILCRVAPYSGHAISTDELPFASVCAMRDYWPLVRVLC